MKKFLPWFKTTPSIPKPPKPTETFQLNALVLKRDAELKRLETLRSDPSITDQDRGEKIEACLDRINEILTEIEDKLVLRIPRETIDKLVARGHIDNLKFGSNGVQTVIADPRIINQATALEVLRGKGISNDEIHIGSNAREFKYKKPLWNKFETVVLIPPKEIRHDSQKIIDWMRENGLRPATYAESLNFVVQNPVFQGSNYFTSLDPQTISGDTRAPQFWWSDISYHLDADYFNYSWDSGDRFLAVRI